MMLGLRLPRRQGVRVLHRVQRAPRAGPDFQFEAEHFRHAQIFFSLYFVMTGLHALHMIIGLGIMPVMLWWSYRGVDHPRVLQPDRDQPGSTGTSSTSSGSSCSRCST